MSQEINLLILDDEQDILDSLKRLFRREQYGLVVTTDHIQALDVLSKEKIKVVVSDQRMPNIVGVDFLKQVKDKYPQVMRILLTGYADLQATQDAINIAEVYRFINKPWQRDDLMTTINRAMAHYDLVEENKRLLKSEQEKSEKLQIMYERQKEFSSTVSHELRTPLSAILMSTEMIANESLGELNADQKEFIGMTISHAERLSRLINDILDLTKLEEGKMKMRLEKLDMNAVIEEVVKIQDAVAKKKGLYLKMELDLNMPDVSYDSDRISQVMHNFVNNAIKFTDSGGVTITSVYDQEKKCVTVSVIDTGPGIGEENLSKVFEKFQQLDDPALNKTGGTGLGLSICKEIIERHNGKIGVTSTQGQGSCFYFLLNNNEIVPKDI